MKVLDQGMKKCEEDADVDTTTINNSLEGTSGIKGGGIDAENSCEDKCSIQLANKIQKNHPVDNIIDQLDQGVTTRRKELVDYRKMVGLIRESCFISKVEPKNMDEALKDEYWISTMQEELHQFQRNDVWELVPRPNDDNIIETKWIFKNKFDELRVVTRNKARLVAQEDRKSTSGGCFFLGNNLVSWFRNLWMKKMLEEYNVRQGVMILYCDNMSVINIFNNPVQHSRTKRIDIRHHFIRKLVEDKVITLEHVSTDKELAEIFTKALDAAQFESFRSSLGLCVIDT
ncbi:hypothetical protein LIER_34958 [Lithospermum erythrorhizon]|uniref:Gag-pol polyprotein n=1 Tax=Lithospermum erythrorhizon TaxID=34254 RepID=A0AAV3NI19_LITER